MCLFRIQFSKIGVATFVEFARRYSSRDGTALISIVATIAESAAGRDADDIIKYVEKAVFTRRQLEFSNSGVVHQDATAGQQMERPQSRGMSSFAIFLTNLTCRQTDGS